MVPFELEQIVSRALVPSDSALSTIWSAPITFYTSPGTLATVWKDEIKPEQERKESLPLVAT